MVVSRSLLRLSRSGPTAAPLLAAIRQSSSSSSSSATPNIHELQSQPRSETLQKARDKAGLTADAVALAVKNTIARQDGDASQPQPQPPTQWSPQPRRTASPSPSRLGSQLAQRRKQSERVFDADAKAIAAGGAQGSRRPGGGGQPGPGQARVNNSRQQPREGAVEGARLWATRSRGDRPPRPDGARFTRSAEGSTSAERSQPQRDRAVRSGPRPPRAPRAPRAPRPAFGLSANVVPASLPAKATPPPSVDLATLIARDIASRAAALKAAVPVQPSAEASQAERLTHRKERAGDYSRWAQAYESSAKGKNSLSDSLKHAGQLLAANPGIGLAGRKVFLDKVAELTKSK